MFYKFSSSCLRFGMFCLLQKTVLSKLILIFLLFKLYIILAAFFINGLIAQMNTLALIIHLKKINFKAVVLFCLFNFYFTRGFPVCLWIFLFRTNGCLVLVLITKQSISMSWLNYMCQRFFFFFNLPPQIYLSLYFIDNLIQLY